MGVDYKSHRLQRNTLALHSPLTEVGLQLNHIREARGFLKMLKTKSLAEGGGDASRCCTKSNKDV